jgi:putative ABC transport system permease protein
MVDGGGCRQALGVDFLRVSDALHLKLGDKLSFDVAGEPLTVQVASIRKIRWDSFRPNFFLVFPPGLLDGAAGTYMTSLSD